MGTDIDGIERGLQFTYDYANLPEADETRVGSGGVSFSGGQKQRVIHTDSTDPSVWGVIEDETFANGKDEASNAASVVDFSVQNNAKKASSTTQLETDEAGRQYLRSSYDFGPSMVQMPNMRCTPESMLFSSSPVFSTLYFFLQTDSGTILNRFRQGMTQVDQVLPVATFQTCFAALGVLAQLGLVASGSWYVAIALSFVFAALCVLQRCYLSTSHQVRHLDLECKAPLYTAFTETLAGLATVRAFMWQNALMSRHLKLLDTSQKAYYLMLCLQRWLNVVLDLFAAGLAILLVAVALDLPGSTSKGVMGLPDHARLRSFMVRTPQETRREEAYPGKWSFFVAALKGRLFADASLYLSQDPVTLSGTVRQNLDLECRLAHDSPDLETMLAKVDVWSVVSARGGLDADYYSSLGFSAGQKQLSCLARAALHKSRVMLLDEAISGVDQTTDEKCEVSSENNLKTLLSLEFRTGWTRLWAVTSSW
ncbi:hypothetical protein J7T55_010256 [Diaporthe amygdali]|uniref:uncharacterized protein n=1 Tax=Phomopsis amygdali TaxID=1214568 RepID=UPI0022FE3E02|nr:uncharacterized protein J7T55_010256 [Diaporthe amygdali]KAJ0107651.1 hypothetical protein J7T55_010256 [Diaporthe amygdali]